MATSTKLYKPEQTICYGDGREQDLLKFIQDHPRYKQMQDSPLEVLSAVDEYGAQYNFLMNVGKDKGRIVAQQISKQQPRVMVELGCYVGYSAILFGSIHRQCGGTKYISLEINPDFAAVASAMIQLAGLHEHIEIVIGPCEVSLREARTSGRLKTIDLLFLDHQKSAYVGDLMLCEDLGLIDSGSVLVADNVISPGAPGYLEYVRASKDERNDLRVKAAQNSAPSVNPQTGLTYDSTLYRGFEPTGEPDGIEISLCKA
ncbi:uncharacterized protein G6M90_00g066430 [Metarhizium brunneum]|uniref:catechol O-methyltransferase n=1 Tax=Metarhizium brunneum TaxID=500148 RepID=A0A7D5YUA7_9HYPO|nr:hypothetical protein G6M90_00g066430 [Metarhizium brunneum]